MHCILQSDQFYASPSFGATQHSEFKCLPLSTMPQAAELALAMRPECLVLPGSFTLQAVQCSRVQFGIGFDKMRTPAAPWHEDVAAPGLKVVFLL